MGWFSYSEVKPDQGVSVMVSDINGKMAIALLDGIYWRESWTDVVLCTSDPEESDVTYWRYIE